MLFRTRTSTASNLQRRCKAVAVDVLVAAHIKRRSACSKKEKLDADNIVMAVIELYLAGLC